MQRQKRLCFVAMGVQNPATDRTTEEEMNIDFKEFSKDCPCRKFFQCDLKRVYSSGWCVEKYCPLFYLERVINQPLPSIKPSEPRIAHKVVK
jgi:hypothetical protein